MFMCYVRIKVVSLIFLFAFGFNAIAISIECKAKSFLLLGDIMLHRQTVDCLNNYPKCNPIVDSSASLKSFEFVVANFEGGVAKKGRPVKGKPVVINLPETSLKLLKENNINYISLANNHSFDYGQKGFLSFNNLLLKHDLNYFGAGLDHFKATKVQKIKFCGKNVGFIGINDIEPNYTIFESGATTASLKMFKSKPLIRKIKSQVDYLIAYVHWGRNHELKVDSRQREMVRFLAENNVDLIVGTHPHYLQETALVKNTKVYYSLGSFTRGYKTTDKLQHRGLGIRMYIENGNLKDEALVFNINKKGWPNLDRAKSVNNSDFYKITIN